MFILRRLHGPDFQRLNAIIDSLEGHITTHVNLVGSASLPLPQVCHMQSLPGTACRVEGHPGERYFPATEPMDRTENLIERGVRELFGLSDEYGVSAQPHAATQANHAVLRAVLGDSTGPVACVAPADGGHISHRLGLGAHVDVLSVPVSDRGIEYEALETLVVERRPRIIVIGGTSYTRGVDYARLRRIADISNAHLHADLAHTAPLLAGELHPPAFPSADSATLDTSKSLRGPRGGILVYRQRVAETVLRALFPVLQSSPDQNAMLAKAACIDHWVAGGIKDYAVRLVEVAQRLARRLADTTGPPVFGGTDTHLVLLDLAPLEIDGREGERRLERARILVNRNQVPGDHLPPWAPSGLRFGSTVPTILGYADDDVDALAEAIRSALNGEDGHEAIVDRLLAKFTHRSSVAPVH